MNNIEEALVQIESLDDLIATLSEEDKSNYGDIIRSLNLPLAVFDLYSSWSLDGYTRNCIARNEKFELILICWEAGQKTPIHDHGGEECWVKVMEGELRENIYKKDDLDALYMASSSMAKKQEVSYMKDFLGFHSLENLTDKRSMTLHLYADPIKCCHVFEEKSKHFVNKDMAYTTIAF